MNPSNATHRLRPLTTKQRRFLHAFLIRGMSQSDAYRTSYGSLGSDRSIACQAYRLVRSRSIRDALRDIESGKLTSSAIFGDSVISSFQKKKKLCAIAEDPDTPKYVALRALELAAECEKEEDNRGASKQQNRSGKAEEIDQLLTAAMEEPLGLKAAANNSAFRSGHG
jgi:hypothetical protein